VSPKGGESSQGERVSFRAADVPVETGRNR